MANAFMQIIGKPMPANDPSRDGVRSLREILPDVLAQYGLRVGTRDLRAGSRQVPRDDRVHERQPVLVGA